MMCCLLNCVPHLESTWPMPRFCVASLPVDEFSRAEITLESRQCATACTRATRSAHPALITRHSSEPPAAVCIFIASNRDTERRQSGPSTCAPDISGFPAHSTSGTCVWSRDTLLTINGGNLDKGYFNCLKTRCNLFFIFTLN